MVTDTAAHVAGAAALDRGPPTQGAGGTARGRGACMAAVGAAAALAASRSRATVDRSGDGAADSIVWCSGHAGARRGASEARSATAPDARTVSAIDRDARCTMGPGPAACAAARAG